MPPAARYCGAVALLVENLAGGLQRRTLTSNCMVLPSRWLAAFYVHQNGAAHTGLVAELLWHNAFSCREDTMDASQLIEIGKWLFVAVVAPVFGWFGGAARDWRAAKRRKKFHIAVLRGLPPEAKAELVDFYRQGAHTKRGNPCVPIVEMMAAQGILKIGPGAGGYAAVNRYLTISPELWEVMDDWICRDPVASAMLLEAIEEAGDLASR